jgi:hypothetical protein
VAKLIIRLATAVGEEVAGQDEEGIAMISNFSMPVNSLSATDSGTSVMVNRKVSTVRPSEIEMGMPVSISTSRMPKMIAAFIGGLLCPGRAGAAGLVFEIVHVQVVVHAIHVHIPGSCSASSPSTWPWSWWGSSPVRRKFQATCRKRKHIRLEPSGMAL